MQISSVTVERLRDKLRPLMRRPDIRLVVVFGSTVTGATHQGSDIDLGLLSNEPLDPVAMTTDIMEYLGSDRVDVVDLRRASPLLAMEALRKGALLYEAHPGEYASFYSLAYRRYVDTAKLRTAQQAAIGRFLAAKGLA